MQNATMYLHFPCFDGLISSVLASEFLERHGWKFERFCPVNYGLRDKWVSTRLSEPCAVIDFLYHPDAAFWADHHSTAFLSDDLAREYEEHKNPWLLYESKMSSSAQLLWKRLSPWRFWNRRRYEEMVYWADKIDSARYTNVEEAILGEAPALEIHRSLALRSDNDYCSFLIRSLRKRSLDYVARLPEVQARAAETRELANAGLDHFRKAAHLDESNGVVVCELNIADNEIVSRYAPFYFFPQARYSIVLFAKQGTAKITAMRNPWMDFESIPLGTIFAQYGGGGHQRVGSVILTGDRVKSAKSVLGELLFEIEKSDSATPQIRQIQRVLA